MSEQPAVTYSYKNILITYDEDKDVWRFNLRGREKSAKSISNAKAAIDAPPPENEKPFERIQCWHNDYGSGYEVVTVTSLVEDGYSKLGWITRKDKTRSRYRLTDLYPVNEHNDKVIAQLKTMMEEINLLRQKYSKLQDKLTSLDF